MDTRWKWLELEQLLFVGSMMLLNKAMNDDSICKERECFFLALWHWQFASFGRDVGSMEIDVIGLAIDSIVFLTSSIISLFRLGRTFLSLFLGGSILSVGSQDFGLILVEKKAFIRNT